MSFWRKLYREKFSESILRIRNKSNPGSSNGGFRLFSEAGILAIFALLGLAILVTLICFWGRDLIWVQFIPQSEARTRIIAEIPFEYSSQLKTKRLREQKRNLVAPVYKIDRGVYDLFEQDIHKLDELLDAFTGQKKLTDAYLFELKNFIKNFNEKHEINISWSDVDILVRRIDEYGRTSVLLDGLSIVREILSEGIFDQNLAEQKNEEYFLNIEVEGAPRHAHNRTENEAIRYLKLRLSATDATADVLQATFRILKTGIKPNIIFDNTATAQKVVKVLQETPTVIEKVLQNSVIIETGSIITEDDYEKLLGYREALRKANVSSWGAVNNLLERFLISSSVLFLMFLFFRTARRDVKTLTKKEIFLSGLLLILNLWMFRTLLWFFELKTFERIPNLIYFLPYVMPFMLSSLLATLLIRTYVGILLGIITSIFCCLMLSQSIEFLIGTCVVTFIGVYFVRHSYIRSQVIRSGALAGIALTATALLLSFSAPFEKPVVLIQMLLGFLNCSFSSMFILTILPFFEKLFKSCTNIRLIELTDYNNPLLIKLQMLASGTYHHSLTVANLAEPAAVSIHANPFLCRTLALYHDIGKLIKPEYFTENQNNKNPHDEKTPFMSALIIKSHVKDGAAIAEAAGLPPRIIDGILEHHGTSTIQYFYQKALKQCEEMNLPVEESSMPGGISEIEQSAFKYDGPRPRSKETLILSLADSIEAASRSLYNPTPQAIEHLINNIVEAKVKERQFDECPITFKELEDLKKSFYFTLLNMLHSRISYSSIKL